MDEDIPPLGVVVASSAVPAPAPPPWADACAPPPATSQVAVGGSPPQATEVAVWPPAAQWAAALLLTVALGLLSWHWYSAQRWATRPSVPEPVELRLNLNRAEEAQLRQLPGVGESLSRRILEQRRVQGGFARLEDLRQVKGVGPATFERLRSLVWVGPYEGEEGVVQAASPSASVRAEPVPSASEFTKPRGGKKELPTGRVDVNRAGVEELQTLPGIGPKMAASILAVRTQQPFTSVEDLRRVRGIGVKTLDRLRPHVTVGEDP